VAAVIAVAATVASAVLAGLGGVLAVTLTHQVAASDGLDLTALAVGAALLGGTSAFGRRGGVFGTVFAVGLLTIANQYLTVTNRAWSTAALGAVALGVGLAVTRLVERFGRPDQGGSHADEEEWAPAGHAVTSAGRSWQPAATTTTSGAIPAVTAGGLWASDEAWGSVEQR
jgi:hypothetical protein